MKKYGQAELMCFLIHKYITEQVNKMTSKEKLELEERCANEIMAQYPSSKNVG